jgi:hypothetical protein
MALSSSYLCFALNVAPNGHVTRMTLSMRRGPAQIFESHATEEEAGRSFRQWQAWAETAEIRPAFGWPIRLMRHKKERA